jgi:stage V sporulation protein G
MRAGDDTVSISSKERKPMQITDIKIRKLFDDGPMKAIVSVTFDAQLAVHDVKVIYAREKYFIGMPSRKNPDDTYRDIVHPINGQFRAMLEAAVIEAYHAEMAAAEEAAAAAAEEVDEETVADPV